MLLLVVWLVDSQWFMCLKRYWSGGCCLMLIDVALLQASIAWFG